MRLLALTLLAVWGTAAHAGDLWGRVVALAIGGREFDDPEMVEMIRGLLKK